MLAVSPRELAAVEVAHTIAPSDRPYDGFFLGLFDRLVARVGSFTTGLPVQLDVPVACEDVMARIDAMFGSARPSEVLLRLELLDLNDRIRQLPLVTELDQIESQITEYAQ